MLTVRTQAVHDLIDDINSTALQVAPLVCYADPEVERDLRLTAETLQHALGRLHRNCRAQTRSLLDTPEAS